MGISARYGANDYRFGHADYTENRNRGYSATDIWNYLNSNIHRLADHNKPGVGASGGQGGLFEYARSQYQQEENRRRQEQERIRREQERLLELQRQRAEAEARRKYEAEQAELRRKREEEAKKAAEEARKAELKEKADRAREDKLAERDGGEKSSTKSSSVTSPDFGSDNFQKYMPGASRQKFPAFDGKTFSTEKGRGWSDSSLNLLSSPEKDITSQVTVNRDIHKTLQNQNSTGSDALSTDQMNSSIASQAKERAQNWINNRGSSNQEYAFQKR